MGRHLANELSEESFRRSRQCFEEAIARDPGYALAWAGLAYCHLNAVDLFVTPREAFEGARRASDRALAIAPGLAEALICRAGVQLWYDLGRAGTEASCREALEAAPDHVSSQRIFAWYLVLMGRTEEALERLTAARSADPWSLENYLFDPGVLYFARRYGEVLESGRRALALFPGAAQVDGLAVRPIERGDALVVPLAFKSEGRTVVEIVAVEERAIERGRSTLAMAAPRVAEPVVRHEWRLLLPEDHRYRFAGGELHPVVAPAVVPPRASVGRKKVAFAPVPPPPPPPPLPRIPGLSGIVTDAETGALPGGHRPYPRSGRSGGRHRCARSFQLSEPPRRHLLPRGRSGRLQHRRISEHPRI